MSATRLLHVPAGSQDLLFDDVRVRRQVQAAWFALAEEHGYREVIPPTFEYEEVFTRGAGPELGGKLIRFVDRDGRVVALRADFTSAVARLAGTKLASAPLPLRLCYAGKVFRQEAEGGGRQREAFQLGAELIGDASAAADVEILRLVIRTLRALRIADFQVNLGDTRFLRPFLDGLSGEDADRLREAIDRKDRAALARVARELAPSRDVAATLTQLPELIGRGEVLRRARELAQDAAARAAVERLEAIDRALSEEERAHVVYDLGEIRGLAYYSDIHFEVFVAGAGRAVGSGGRYDHLLALYGEDRPAVGFMLEIDALVPLVAPGGPS